jgi:hypothetical protein
VLSAADGRSMIFVLQLRGSIPAEFAAAPHLWWLDVGYNRFSGAIPASFMCAAHTLMNFILFYSAGLLAEH